MILSCNSCDKKFVVPDKAITSSGRLVQCGSCGNKWKQFPITVKKNEVKIEGEKLVKRTIVKSKKNQPAKKKVKKTREINLYSPEYLQKKHGININNVEIKKTVSDKKVSLGFYNSLILLIIIVIVISRCLYFFQDFIVQNIPMSKFYLDYFFENIRNMFEIWKDLISSY